MTVIADLLERHQAIGDLLEQLEAVKPEPSRPCEAAIRRRRLDRIEDYLFIGGGRISAARAAERLGVSSRTITRYRAALRAVTGQRPLVPQGGHQ